MCKSFQVKIKFSFEDSNFEECFCFRHSHLSYTVITIIINLEVNSTRKSAKYLPLKKMLKGTYREVKFVNVSMSAVGALENSWDSLLDMLNNLNTPYNLTNHPI